MLSCNHSAEFGSVLCQMNTVADTLLTSLRPVKFVCVRGVRPKLVLYLKLFGASFTEAAWRGGCVCEAYIR